MFVLKIFISVLFFSSFCCIECSYGKLCMDCVNFKSCPGAAELVINLTNRDEVTSKFNTSFCGYEYLRSKRIIKVCCSDFTVPTGDVEPLYPVVKDGIETHPNLKLLPESCGNLNVKKKSGGIIAKIYEFPWMAFIFYKTRVGKQFKCSGTIINSKYILTAAHCVSDTIKIAGVRIGEFDIRYNTDCQGEESQIVCESHIQDIRVENIIPHPNFTGYPDPQNDVALIRLKKPVNFNYKNALPICLPVTQKLRSASLAGTIGVVAGWGLTEADIYSPVLLKANILIKTDHECSRLMYKSNPASDTDRILKEICGGEKQEASCRGDSGGPLMVLDVYEGVDRYIQYGIISRGPTECGSEPAVFTDVTKYMWWILDTIKE